MGRKSATATDESASRLHASPLARLRAFYTSRPLLSFAIVSACLLTLLYFNVLSAPFVYDDQDQIQNNPFLLSWRSVVVHYLGATHSFNTVYRGAGAGTSYRPIFWLSLALDRYLFHLDVVGFHITNLLLHWIDGLLAFVLLRRLGHSRQLSTAVVLIWLVLPINSEAVAWISGRAYSLLTFFVLSSLLLADQYLRNGKRFWLVSCCLAQAGALLSHEAGILAMPFVLLLTYSRRRTTSYSSRPLYIFAGAISLVYLCLRIRGFGSSINPHSWSLLPIGTTMAKYIAWIILPINMSIERSTETPSNAWSLGNVIGTFALLLIVVATIYLRRKMPEISTGLIWIVLALLPFSGIVFLYQGIAERYCYLASLGVVFVLVDLSYKAPVKTRYLALGLVTLWALWGVWRLHSRLQDWENDLSLYASSLKTDPDSPVLLVNLGSTLLDTGRLADAVLMLDRAIALKPDYELAHRNLGNVYVRLGALRQAKSSYQKAVALQPDDVKALINLGDTDVRLKDLGAAEREFRRAISVSPESFTAYCDLGIVLFNEGKTDQAMEQLTTAIKVAPADPSPYYFLGFIDEQLGAGQAALSMYEKALQLEPHYSPARNAIDRLEHQLPTIR